MQYNIFEFLLYTMVWNFSICIIAGSYFIYSSNPILINYILRMCVFGTPYHTNIYQTPVAVLYDMFMSWLMFWKDQYRETEENQWKKLLGWAISCRCVNQSPSCFREGSTKNEGYKWHEKKYNVLIHYMHVW